MSVVTICKIKMTNGKLVKQVTAESSLGFFLFI